ncbi:MAG TPA: hypothetical protein VHC69_19230 [Polyangiaceae bacterium]|nr:hypothetical protein [Polyangiaceae bacterium]
MSKSLFALAVLACACGSDSSGAPSKSAGANGDSCPDVAGTWAVTKHCDASLVGASAVVSESNCALSFQPPFNGFTGSVGADGSITLSGPQSCSGTVSQDSISLSCTPSPCDVALSRSK